MDQTVFGKIFSDTFLLYNKIDKKSLSAENSKGKIQLRQ